MRAVQVVIDQQKDVGGADTVDVLSDVLDDLRILPKHRDGQVPPWVVGWSADGRQYCLKCRPKMPATTKDDLAHPVIVGDPDWGEGSVPVCKDCGKEIFTLFEPNHKG